MINLVRTEELMSTPTIIIVVNSTRRALPLKKPFPLTIVLALSIGVVFAFILVLASAIVVARLCCIAKEYDRRNAHLEQELAKRGVDVDAALKAERAKAEAAKAVRTRGSGAAPLLMESSGVGAALNGVVSSRSGRVPAARFVPPEASAVAGRHAPRRPTGARPSQGAPRTVIDVSSLPRAIVEPEEETEEKRRE